MIKISKIKDTGIQAGKNAWLAGLGVYAFASETAGKSFQNLVEQGEKRQVSVQDEKDPSALNKIQDKASSFKTTVENLIKRPVNGVRNQLGLPRQGELEALNQKIQLLTDKIQGLDLPVAKTSK